MKVFSRKGILVFFALVMLAFTAACGSSSQSSEPTAPSESGGSSGEKVTFKMGHMAGTDHVLYSMVAEPFSKEVLEATDGRVHFELYPGGALAAANEQWESVVTGIQDVAWHVNGYTAGKFPLHSIINLPHVAKGNAEQVSEVVWKLYEEFPEIQAEYEEVKPLWLFGTDEYVILTSNKEIKTFEDVKGLKLRAPNPEGAAAIEAWGATPVSMSATDLYDALQKGVVDGSVSPVAHLKDYNLFDVIKYVTHGSFSNSLMSEPMNKAAWERLSDEDKQILEEQFLGLPMSLRAGAAFDVQYERSVEEGKEHGIVFNHLPEEELAKFEAASQTVIDAYISDLEAKGLPAQKVLDRTRELFEEFAQQ